MKRFFSNKSGKGLRGVRDSAALQQFSAAALAEKLGVPLLPAQTCPDGLFLDCTDRGLALCDGRPGAPGAVRADFLDPALLRRLQRVGARSELLVRAVGARQGHRPRVVDATAGLGGDGLILAHAGCTVTLLERSPVVVALLDDAIRRVRAARPDNPAAGLTLIETDAVDWLQRHAASGEVEVVCLDPMYPDRRDSAAVRKEMQLFKQLLGNEQDQTGELLQAALACASRRVVVKRPRKAPALDGPKPSHVIAGRSTRFDVYMTREESTS